MTGYFFVTLDSEAINYVTYWTEDEVGVMEIGFKHGGRYQYRNVPLQLAVNLITAPSAGQFFGSHIRGQFGGR